MASTTAAPVWNPDLNYRGDHVIAAGGIMVTLAGLTIIGRLYTRFVIVKQPGIEEAWIVLAWLASVVTLVTYVMMRKNGLGHHVDELQPYMIGNFFKWFWVCIWIYNISLTATKFSIVFQYKRIFVTDRFQLAVKAMLVILTIYGLWTALGCIFICWPVSKFWDHTQPGKCMPQWPIFFGNSYLNIITDLMIILSPLPVLSNLQMPKRQKLALGGVFLIGSLVCIISVVRLVLLYQAQSSPDFSYDNVAPATWSIIEANVAIITSSAPALKAIVIRIFPGFGSTRSGTNSKAAKYGRSTAAEKSRNQTNIMSRNDDTDYGHEMRTGIMGGALTHGDEEQALVEGKINVMTTITAEVNSDSDSTGSRSQSRNNHGGPPFN
ncbi:hypothetical protein CAC42_312 [Sphaceloma murrayae]|uniref:Rhodopsin domain-containing protein n=1 Tax=Sphaceloma murrayae TaxID=2082308 RepID=A0A2K1QZW1_9PEZI|nr:hypothetical protein CAC42_312 [Sphaceloma murrayae]